MSGYIDMILCYRNETDIMGSRIEFWKVKLKVINIIILCVIQVGLPHPILSLI